VVIAKAPSKRFWGSGHSKTGRVPKLAAGGRKPIPKLEARKSLQSPLTSFFGKIVSATSVREVEGVRGVRHPSSSLFILKRGLLMCNKE
jgi:hypothetical protein